jgi:hypothetical protein
MKPGPIQAANGPIAPDASGVLRDADGNPVVSQQRYGLHEINEVLRLNPVANARNKDVVTNEQLIAAARSELAAAGEQTDLAAIMTATGGRPGPFPIAALKQWCGDIFARHDFAGGGGGRLILCSHFLLTWQFARVAMMEEISLKEKCETITCFAMATHRWHMEVFKEHEVALSALRAADGSVKGAKLVSETAERRYAAIARGAGEKIDDETLTHGQVARQRFEKINIELELAKFPRIESMDTMETTIKRVRARRGYRGRRSQGG